MYLKALEEKGISNFMVSYFLYNSTNVQLELYFQYYHFSFFDAIRTEILLRYSEEYLWSQKFQTLQKESDFNQGFANNI